MCFQNTQICLSATVSISCSTLQLVKWLIWKWHLTYSFSSTALSLQLIPTPTINSHRPIKSTRHDMGPQCKLMGPWKGASMTNGVGLGVISDAIQVNEPHFVLQGVCTNPLARKLFHILTWCQFRNWPIVIVKRRITFNIPNHSKSLTAHPLSS